MSEYPDPNKLTVFTELPTSVRVHTDQDGNLASGPRQFPEGYATNLREAVKDYREVYRAYHEALPTPEEGNLRQKQAQEAQRQAIADGVANGLSPDEIWRRTGSIAFMPNAFAREVVQAYEEQLRRKAGILRATLAQHKDRLEGWLQTSDLPESEAALATLEALTANA